MSLRRLTLPVSCFVAGVMLAGWGLRISAPALAEDNAPAAADANSAKALVEAAKGAYEIYFQRRAVDANAQNDPEYVYRWSRRWLEAGRALSMAKDKRVAAHTAHLERMRSLQATQEHLIKVAMAAPGDLPAVKFYRIEAEKWLADAKAQ